MLLSQRHLLEGHKGSENQQEAGGIEPLKSAGTEGTQRTRCQKSHSHAAWWGDWPLPRSWWWQPVSHVLSTLVQDSNSWESECDWLSPYYVPSPREREDGFLSGSLEEGMCSLCHQNDTREGRTIPSNEIRMLWKGINVGQSKATNDHFLHIFLRLKIHDWLTVREAMHVWAIWETSVPSGQYCCEPELLYKIKSIKKHF